MCPCDDVNHYLCPFHRSVLVNDLLCLRRAEADGRGYDDDVRALRGRLLAEGWRREAVERDLDYGGEEYARADRPPSASVTGRAAVVALLAATITNGATT